MTSHPHTRSTRYSRPPSLSTVISNEEANFSDPNQSETPQVSPYTGGASNRNSIVSPAERYGQFPVHIANPGAQPYTVSHFSRDHQDHTTRGTFVNSRPTYDLERKIAASRGFDHQEVPFAEEKSVVSSGFDMSDVQSTTNSVEGGLHAVKYMKTRYMWMLLQLDQVPNWHNIVAAISTWIILAAYLVVPGTFTSFKNSESLNDNQGKDPSQIQNIAHAITNSVDHVGLLALSGILAGVGSFNCIVLWIVHWKNYVWLCWKIFAPVMLNSFAGLLTTVVSVYTAQDGVWSITAKINAVITGSVAFLGCGVYCMYNFWLLEGVKKDHRKHFPVDAELVDPMKPRGKGLSRFEKMFPGE